jgi:hypothetical protein
MENVVKSRMYVIGIRALHLKHKYECRSFNGACPFIQRRRHGIAIVLARSGESGAKTIG